MDVDDNVLIVALPPAVDCCTLRQVTNMVAKFRGRRQTSTSNGSLVLLDKIQAAEGHYLAFKLDADGLLERVFWAYRGQRANAVKYGSVVILDTTFNTNE